MLFKNPRDNTQVVNLSKHMYPGRVKFMQEAYRDATSITQGYLVVDLKQATREHLRLRTNIVPEPDKVQYAYLPKIKWKHGVTPVIRHVSTSEELCLCLLAKADHIFAKCIIIKGKHDLIQSLCECSVNILKGNARFHAGTIGSVSHVDSSSFGDDLVAIAIRLI